MDLRQWVVEGVLRPGIMCVVFFGAVELSAVVSAQPTWAGLIGRVAVVGAVYAVLFWFLGLRGNERNLIVRRLGAVRVESGQP